MEVPSPGRPPRSGRLGNQGRDAFFFLSPWLLGLSVLTMVPMGASLYLSFTDYDLLSSPEWVGFENFIRMFTSDPRYLTSVRVTFIYVALTVPLKLMIALAVALILRRTGRGSGVYRALFYLPSLLGGSVAIAMLWRQIFGINGVVNRFTGELDLRSRRVPAGSRCTRRLAVRDPDGGVHRRPQPDSSGSL